MTGWPDIPYERWAPTGASLHMWLQIAGKARLASERWLNHSWHATFYVNARGLTSSLVQGRDVSFEMIFDFVAHTFYIRNTDGRAEEIALAPMPVATFHEKFCKAARRIGVGVSMSGIPNEVPDALPFSRQTAPGVYEPQVAQDFWRALVTVDRVFKTFRTAFLGKVSPVHLFWGSLDLAVTRFSGRRAPRHPGGIPALPDDVTREAYSHEVSSAGFWAGGAGIDYPAFYSYAYPAPKGFADIDPGAEEAFFETTLGEFILPYDAVRTAKDPEAKLLAFLRATYAGAADLAHWDRAALECATGIAGVPRVPDN